MTNREEENAYESCAVLWRLGHPFERHSRRLSKPMVNIGIRPILWHIMKYYAHFGHKEFILCLGYRADVIKQFFLTYDEHLSSDFTLENGSRKVHMQESDIEDWKITCVDTGLKSNIGQRLKAVEKYVKDEEFFLSNYADALTDLRLPEMVDTFTASDSVASFLCVKPSQSFSVVSLGHEHMVDGIRFVRDTNILINGGYFVFRKDIFRYMRDGEELVVEPFQRLIRESKLMGYRYRPVLALHGHLQRATGAQRHGRTR